MKIQNIKFAVMAATAVVILSAAGGARAQALRTGEVVYGRTQTETNGACTTASIWAVGLDGSNDRFIAYGRQPRISPDGRKLLYKRWASNVTCTTGFEGYFGWFILDLESRVETQIGGQNQGGSGAYFSPETNRADRQITVNEGGTMCQNNLDGSGQTCFFGQIEPIRGFGHPSVRGDDYRIVAHNYDDNPNGVGGLYNLDYDGTNVQKIPGTTYIDLSPSWSNDGQIIAYARYTLQCCRTGPYYFLNLYLIRPDGASQTQLTFVNNLQPGEGFTYSLVWTLDNQTILDAARLNGVTAIYKIAADGGGIQGTIPITPGAPPEWVGGIVPVRGEQQIAAWNTGVTTGGTYRLADTVGQGFAGQISAGGTFSVQSGFWARDGQPNKAPFDFDNDGRTDLSLFRPAGGAWYVNRSLEGFLPQDFGLASDKLAAADYDADGQTDFAVWRPSDGNWYIFRSSSNTLTVQHWGENGDRPVPADYDGDGRADFALWRPATGVWYVLTSDTAGGIVARGWGVPGDKPVAGDYDGDGKTDLAVYRPANGTWYISRSSDDGLTATTFGLSSIDQPVPADYDGDRKTDVAVFRPPNGTWYVSRSTGGFSAQPFGIASDTLVPGDYDGDGRAEPAVYRAGTWYLLRSRDGYAAAQFGLSSDVPVPSAYVP